MNFDIKCSCGDQARYQNMRNGKFVMTCGTSGCLKEKPINYAANTNLMGDHLIGNK